MTSKTCIFIVPLWLHIKNFNTKNDLNHAKKMASLKKLDSLLNLFLQNKHLNLLRKLSQYGDSP